MATRIKTWRSGPPSQSPDFATLHSLYVQELCSYGDIARRFGVSKTAVMRWLRAAGIPARSISTATSIAQKGKKLEGVALESARRKITVARGLRTEETFLKQSASMMGKPAWNKGNPWTVEHRERQMVTRRSEEYRRRLSEAQKGDKAHNWRGGITSADDLHMHGWEWRQRRSECYARDGWTCQDCRKKCKSGPQAGPLRIQAHHIIPRRHGGGDELENLVTLCMSCHMKREHRYAAALFG